MHVKPLSEPCIEVLKQNKTEICEFLDQQYLLLAGECATASTDQHRVYNAIKLGMINELSAAIENIIDPVAMQDHTNGYNQ